MQVRKTIWMLTALSAMSLVMTGCPEDGETSTTCASATDCLESEICHPTAKVCVATCASSGDCPETAKTCAAVSTTDQTKVCQCTTDELCNRGRETADLVCSNLDKVCTPKCTSDAACGAGRTCDTATGQCKAGSTPGTACTGTSQSTCTYGQFCSNNVCTAAPVAPMTCQNFANNRPNWSATTSNGPVIYDLGVIRYETNSSFCQSGDAYILRIRAYRTDANWPATRGEVAGFFYVNTGGTQVDVVTSGLLVPNTGYNRNAANLRDAEFQTYLCPGSNVPSIQVAYYFTGGNPVCQQVSRP
jgi:hypothetical protein